MSNIWKKLKERFIDSEYTETNSETLDPYSNSAYKDKNVEFESVPSKQIPKERDTTRTYVSKFDLFLEHAKKHNKIVKKYRIKYVSDIAEVVRKHYRTLKTKYNQLVYTDDYGRVIIDDFLREFGYFVSKILINEAPSCLSDAYITKDPTLFNSYKNLYQYFMALSDMRKDEAERITDYSVHPLTFFCFTIQIKQVNNIDDIKIQDSNLECGINFGVSIVEHSPVEKQRLVRFEELNKYIFDKSFELAYLIFEHTRNIESSVERAILKIPGTKKVENLPEKPLDYERYVSDSLKNLGFTARTTKASGDQGADVLAEKNGVSFAIQCKMYSKPVGNKAVQEANAGRDFYKKDYGVVVSNAKFTKSAQQAASACGVILLNDNMLDKLLEYTNKQPGT